MPHDHVRQLDEQSLVNCDFALARIEWAHLTCKNMRGVHDQHNREQRMLTVYFGTGLIAYLLGSIPFGLILVRVFRGVDVRTTGSGNIGATNVARVAPGLGVLTLVLDTVKGAAAVVFARAVASAAFASASEARLADGLVGVSAMLAIVGHMFSVWLKFKGGKGVATALGVFLALTPVIAMLAIAVFAVVFAIFRYVSLASISSAIAFPVLALLVGRRQTIVFLPYICFACLLIIAKHHQNIRRLLSGNEPHLSFKH